MSDCNVPLANLPDPIRLKDYGVNLISDLKKATKVTISGWWNIYSTLYGP